MENGFIRITHTRSPPYMLPTAQWPLKRSVRPQFASKFQAASTTEREPGAWGGRAEEDGLREVHLAGDSLHERCGQMSRVRKDPQRIPAEGGVGEDIERVKRKIHETLGLVVGTLRGASGFWGGAFVPILAP